MTLFTYYTTGSSPTNNSKEIFANRYGNSYSRSLLVAPRNSSSQVSCRKSSKPWADVRRISLKNIDVCLTNLPSTTFDTYQPPLANMYLRPPCLTWGLATTPHRPFALELRGVYRSPSSTFQVTICTCIYFIIYVCY